MSLSLVHLPLFMVIGIATDWALFWRFETDFGMAGLGRTAHRYRDLLFPRIVVSVVGIGLLFLGRQSNTPALTIAGGALFLGAIVYAAGRLLFGKGR